MMKQNWVKKADAASQAILVTSIITMGFTALASLITIPAYADDTDVVDTINITVPTACTMGGTIVTGQEHSTSMQPGTYEANIGKTTLTTYCNDPDGFSIYAIGFTGDEYSGTNHTKLVGNNASNTISTGLTTGSSTTDASSWAMKLTAVTGTYAPTVMNGTGGTENFTNYHVVPDTYTKVATFPSTTDAEGVGSTGSSLETTYAVYASLSQPADTYTGKVKYTLVHPATEEPVQPQPSTAGYINYYANASTAVGTMGRQLANDGNTAKLFASNFSREGYGFAGWSDAYDYATNANAHFYGPNETITVPTGTTANGLALYAVWVKSAGTMQANGTSVCNNLTAATYSNEGDADESTWSITAGLSSISALTDTRDNQTYAIAKLTDGKCWMIENLRLADKDSSNNDIILSSTNTNNPSLPLTNLYNTSSTSNHLSPTSSVAYDASTAPEGWCTTDSVACDDQSRIRTDNTSNRVTYTTTQTMSADANLYSYGNYYNWYSATAGNGTYAKSSGETAGDICPTGWHLPTGDLLSSSEFGLLSNSLGGYKNASNVAQTMSNSTTPTGDTVSQRLRHFPNNLLYSGSVSGASLSFRGSSSRFWSSSAGSNSSAYFLYFDSSYINPGTRTNSKYYGGPARCIATTN